MNIDMNKKKRKADEAFDPNYDYVYGIVTGTSFFIVLRVSIVRLSIEFH